MCGDPVRARQLGASSAPTRFEHLLELIDVAAEACKTIDAESRVVFLAGRTTRGRLSFGFSLGAEVFARYGIAAALGVRGFVSFSVGYGTSIGPTS